MYGIIGTAIASGVLFLQISKKGKIKSIKGANIFVPKKDNGLIRYIIGGTIFGLGWALIGACPGPMYILLGTGVWSMLIVIAAAVIGTFIYGILKNKLPH
jgi:uncharacterized membrane protein YedE/YeeE